MTTTIRLRQAALLIPAAAIALLAAGCSTARTGPSPAAKASASAAASQSAAAAAIASEVASQAAASAAAPPPCTSHACIISEIQQSLVGTSAKDGSAITAVKCRSSSVKHNAGDTYTASCDVTYSDGTVYNGYANILVAQNQVTFEPQYEVSGS